MRRWAFNLILLGAAAGGLSVVARPAKAQEEARRPQLSAAASDASETLRLQILEAHITPTLTIGQLLARTGGMDALNQRLQNADQRGGTRWRDELTCEIRLEVSGADVADLLTKQTALHAQEAGMTSEAVRQGIAEVHEQTFSALGRSTGSYSLDRIRPPENVVVWQRVKEGDVVDALKAAKGNAIARVIESIRPVDIGGGKHLDDALAVPAVVEELRQWVGGRPFTRIEFREDMEIVLTVSVPMDEFWPMMQSTLVRNHWGPAASDTGAWTSIHDEVSRAIVPAVGRSTAGAPATTRHAPLVPREPPAWISDQLNADGVSSGAGLRTARAAETVALENLRTQLEKLPLNQESNLGDAARHDPRIERALADVIRRAPTSKVDYQGKGVVKVRVSLDLSLLWRRLSLLE